MIRLFVKAEVRCDSVAMLAIHQVNYARLTVRVPKDDIIQWPGIWSLELFLRMILLSGAFRE